jgi:hypothetical protein
MKPGKTFKLSKTTKRMIALMKGSTADQRNQFKHMMIDAQLCAAVQPKRESRKPGSGNLTTHGSGTVSSGD